MKTKINEEGKLSITPETGLEAFALRRWSDDWEQHQVTLEIRTSLIETVDNRDYKNIKSLPVDEKSSQVILDN